MTGPKTPTVWSARTLRNPSRKISGMLWKRCTSLEPLRTPTRSLPREIFDVPCTSGSRISNKALNNFKPGNTELGAFCYLIFEN